MNRCDKAKILFFLFSILCTVPLFSADIKIMVAPFASFDSNGETDEFFKGHINLVSSLQKLSFGGLVEFESLDILQTGKIMSNFDAAKICQSKKIEYLLFGFITRSEKTLSAELRLYDSNQKKVIKSFYAQDNDDELERLLLTQKDHIAEYLEKETGTKPETVERETNKLRVSIPLFVGWWSFLNKSWDAHFDGIVNATTGVSLKPSFLGFNVKNKEFYFSTSVLAGFKYAKGNEDYYPANFYSVNASILFSISFDFARNNTLSIGLGPLYEYDILQITLKYEDPKTFTESNVGMIADFNWAYKVNRILKLHAGIQSGIFFFKNSPSWISAGLGMTFNFTRKKAELK